MAAEATFGTVSPETGNAISAFWAGRAKDHGLSHSPTRFYATLQRRYQTTTRLENDALYDGADTNTDSNKVRFVCTSDTHCRTDLANFLMPDGDVLLHAGDFSMVGQEKEIEHFAEWLDSLPYPIKIVVSGNHELSFDPTTTKRNYAPGMREKLITRLSQSCVFLEDSVAVVHGIRIFGSPWQPEFCNWAYNLQRGEECLQKWQEIPSDTDILITHGPPVGHGDLCYDGVRAGCVDLLQEVQCRIKPQYHLFGHIHEDMGITTDGQTTFINASMVTLKYKPKHYPIIIDMDKKSEEMVLESAPAAWTLSDPRLSRL